MSPELVILESIIGRLLKSTAKNKHDKVKHSALDELQTSLPAKQVHDSAAELWNLITIQEPQQVSSLELNAMEKLLSYGLINLDSNDFVEKVVQLVVNPKVSSNSDCQLECIKIILSLLNQNILSDSYTFKALNTLYFITKETRIEVNKSAASAAMIQILNDQMGKNATAWLGKVDPKFLDVETVCSITEIIEKYPEKFNYSSQFILKCCAMTDSKVFQTLLNLTSRSIKKSADFAEIILQRLLLGHLYQDSDSNSRTVFALRSQENKLVFLDWFETNFLELYRHIDENSAFDPVALPLIDILCQWIERKDTIPPLAGKPPPPVQVLENFSKALSKKSLEVLIKLIPSITESSDATEVNNDNQRTRREAVKLFNRKPSLGLSFALTSEVASDNVKFLMTRGISKAALGEFLSDPNQEELLAKFLGSINMEKLSFIEALREFLQLFRLPGEAQKIDRIVEMFSKQYCWFEDAQIKDPTLAYQLAFMTVMLNTDLHSPQVDKKMTLSEFLTNCKGLENIETLPEHFLVDLYHEISEDEIKLAETFVISPPLGLRDIPGKRGSSFRSSIEPISSAIGYALLHQTSLDELLNVAEDILEFQLTNRMDTKCFWDAINPALSVAMLPWFYDIIERHSDNFNQSTWSMVLGTLARFDPSSCVDQKHNIREISLTTLNPSSMLALAEALNQAKLPAEYSRHWATKLELLPSCCLEKLCLAELSKTLNVLGCCFQNPILRNSIFTLIIRICQEQLPVLEGNDYALPELVQILVQMGLDPEPKIADESFGLFRLAADLLYTRYMSTNMNEMIEESLWSTKWYSILTGLSHAAIQQDNVVLSGNAIRILLEIIRQQGHIYPAKAWKRLVRAAIQPILEDLGMQRGRLATDLALKTLNWLIDIVSAYSSVILEETDLLCHLLEWNKQLIQRPNEELAKSALIALNDLIVKSYNSYQPEHWDQVIKVYTNLIEWTMPTELLHSTDKTSIMSSRLSLTSVLLSGSTASLDGDGFHVARYKCALHLLVLHSLKDLLVSGANPAFFINMLQVELILVSIDQSASFAHAFNSDTSLRTSLWQAGFLPIIDNILLAKQEAAAAQLTLTILFDLLIKRADLKDSDPMKFKDEVEQRLKTTCLSILDHYVGLLSDRPDMGSIKKSIKSWPTVITFLFEKLMQIPRASWIRETFEPSLTIWKLDQGQTALACHEFLMTLAKTYIFS